MVPLGSIFSKDGKSVCGKIIWRSYNVLYEVWYSYELSQNLSVSQHTLTVWPRRDSSWKIRPIKKTWLGPPDNGAPSMVAAFTTIFLVRSPHAVAYIIRTTPFISTLYIATNKPYVPQQAECNFQEVNNVSRNKVWDFCVDLWGIC